MSARKVCSKCGLVGHNKQTCGRFPEQLLPAENGSSWLRHDGRMLFMPWTLEQLWERLSREAYIAEQKADLDAELMEQVREPWDGPR